MSNVRHQFRFLVAVMMLVSTAIFLEARGRQEIFLPRQPLSSFPYELSNWVGSDIGITTDIRSVLGPGDFLLRVYKNTSAPAPLVDLFVAYFPTQRTGDTIHSPRNCLPGAGWIPMQSSRVQISLPQRAPFLANRYVIAKGQDRELVLYWYLAHGRAVASEYWAKFYLVADAIRMNRSDGSLIRLTTPIRRGEEVEEAQKRLLSFARQIVPRMNDYVPR
jgi:EpsI family protein